MKLCLPLQFSWHPLVGVLTSCFVSKPFQNFLRAKVIQGCQSKNTEYNFIIVLQNNQERFSRDWAAFTFGFKQPYVSVMHFSD